MKELNYIAQLIIDCFNEIAKENPNINKAYVKTKSDDMKNHQNKYKTLSWADYSLDSKTYNMLADKLNVSVDDLNTTCEVLKRL